MRKFQLPVLSLIIIVFSLKSLFAQTISATYAIPFETPDFSARLVGEGLSLGESGYLEHIDLGIQGNDPKKFALTSAHGSWKHIWVGGDILDVPDLSIGFPLAGFTVCAVSEGLQYAGPRWFASIGAEQVIIPDLSANILSGAVSLVSDPISAFVGTFGFQDLSLSLLWAESRSVLMFDNTNRLGGFSGNVGIIALRWREWGALCGYLRGDGNVATKNWVVSLFNLPWIEGSGLVDFRYAATWGSLSLNRPLFDARLDMAAAVFLNCGASASWTVGGSAPSSGEWSFAAQYGGIVLLHPEIGWKPFPGLRVSLGRWVPYVFSSDSSLSLSTGNLSVSNMLLSGMELTCSFSLN